MPRGRRRPGQPAQLLRQPGRARATCLPGAGAGGRSGEAGWAGLGAGTKQAWPGPAARPAAALHCETGCLAHAQPCRLRGWVMPAAGARRGARQAAACPPRTPAACWPARPSVRALRVTRSGAGRVCAVLGQRPGRGRQAGRGAARDGARRARHLLRRRPHALCARAPPLAAQACLRGAGRAARRRRPAPCSIKRCCVGAEAAAPRLFSLFRRAQACARRHTSAGRSAASGRARRPSVGRAPRRRDQHGGGHRQVHGGGDRRPARGQQVAAHPPAAQHAHPARPGAPPGAAGAGPARRAAASPAHEPHREDKHAWPLVLPR